MTKQNKLPCFIDRFVNIIDNIDVQIIIANAVLHKNLQASFNLIALALILTTRLKVMYHNMVLCLYWKSTRIRGGFKTLKDEHLSEKCYQQCKFTLQFNRIENGICDKKHFKYNQLQSFNYHQYNSKILGLSWMV